MSFSSYANYRTALRTWLDIGTDVTDAQIDDLSTVAEARINKEIRHETMESAMTLTVAGGVAAWPADYVALKHAYVSQTPVQWLDRKSVGWIYQNYPNRSDIDVPKFIAREGSNFIFGKIPADGTIIRGIYYKRFVALSSSLSALFTASPDLYLYATLAEAAPFLKGDARIAVWETKYKTIKDAVNNEDNDEDWSGSTNRITVA